MPQIRVIGSDGGQLGVMSVDRALTIADSEGFDLVEVSPKAMPPVCRIMDYGKFKYEISKKGRGTPKHTAAAKVKEVKFRPKTDDHDMNFKLDHIRRFLGEGSKVRLVVAFRGREITHPDIGRKLLLQVCKDVSNLAMIEQMPGMDAKRMIMVVAPKVGVAQRPVSAPAPSTTQPSEAQPRPTGPAGAPQR